MSRPRLLVAAAAAALLAGCTYCDGQEELARARTGDLAAVQLIGEVGDPRVPSSASLTDVRIDEAIAAIASFLQADDALLRVQAVESVRRLATRARDVYRNKFPDLLDPSLSDPEVEVRWRAAWAMGRIERTSPALRAALADPHPLVAERVAWALGEVRDEEAIDGLIGALEREPRVAGQAARALGRITGLRHGPEPDAWRAWGRQWRARRQMGEQDGQGQDEGASPPVQEPPTTPPEGSGDGD